MKIGKALLFGATVVVSALAYATPPYGYKVLYYADASHSGGYVGRSEFTCSGRTYTSGTVTEFYEIYDEVPC